MTRKQLTKPSRTRAIGPREHDFLMGEPTGEFEPAPFYIPAQTYAHLRSVPLYSDYKPPRVVGSYEDFQDALERDWPQHHARFYATCDAALARGMLLGTACGFALWALLLAAAWGLCAMMGVG